MLRRAAVRLLDLVGICLVAMASLVAGVLLHVGTRPGLALVAWVVPRVTGDALRGKVLLDAVGSIGPRGARGVDLRVLSEEGRTLVWASGVDVDLDVGAVVKGALFAEGPLDVRVDTIAARHLALDLGASRDADGTSTLALVRALSAKVPGPPSPGPPPTVRLDRILVHHAWIYGSPTDGVRLDADLTSLDATFTMHRGDVDLGLRYVDLHDRALVPGASLFAKVSARGRVPVSGPPSAIADVNGALGTLPFVLSAEALEGRVHALVAVPRNDGRGLTLLVPALTPRPGVGARVEIVGRLAGTFRVEGEVSSAGGSAQLFGRGTLAAPMTVDAGLVARGVDVSAWVQGPPSKLDLDARARASFPPGGGPSAEAHVTLRRGAEVDGVPLPPVVLDATLDPRGDVRADADIAEPGAATRAHAELTRAGRLTFSTTTQVSLATVTRAAGLGAGAGTVTTNGVLDVHTLALSADAAADLRGADVNGVRIAEASVRAHVGGPAKSPDAQVTVAVKRVRVGEKRALGRLDATADVHVGDGVLVTGARVEARSRGETLTILAPSTLARGGVVHLQDARIEGLGATLTCDVTAGRGAVSARVAGHDLDLARVGRLVADPTLRGKVDVESDVRIAGKELEGELRVSLRDGALPGVSRAAAEVDVALHERRGHVHVDVDLGDALTADLRADDLVLHAPALSEAAWLGAEGSAYLVANADLTRLHEVLPELEEAPVRLTGGRARVLGGFLHGHDGRLPSVDLSLATSGLTVALSGAAGRPTTIGGIDVGAEARIDGTTGFSALSARVSDGRGPVAALDTKLEAPLDALLAGQSGLGPWRDRPVGVRLTIPERNLANLPKFIDTAGTTGRVSADVVLEGTLAHPTLRVAATADDLRLRGASQASNVTARVVYDGARAEVTATLEAQGGSAKLTADASAKVDDLLAGRPLAALAWKAGASLVLDKLPLGIAPGAREARLRGGVSGKITLDDYHHDAALALDLRGDQIVVGDAKVPQARVRAQAAEGDALVEANVDAGDGTASALLKAKIAWGARLVPEVDASQALEGRFVARALRAAIVAPFVTSYAADLDGRIDADTKVRAGVDGKNVSLEGTLVARDFSFVLAALGQELRDVGAKARFLPGGVVEVREIHLSDGAGKLDGAAVARFDDLTFVGANATLHIPKETPLDLVNEGQSLGDVSGDVRVSARNRRREKVLDVDVDVPSLQVKLLETAGRRVQDLKARPDVRVGFGTSSGLASVALTRPRTAPEGAASTSDGSVTNVAIRLGKDVEVRRGQKIAITLTGNPAVKIANGKTDVSGQIQLTGGALDLSGRKFSVERGTVTFGAEPTNPVVVATASWVAADKSRVFADFVGPVKSGKLTLRSEPARTPSEILTLLAFGSTDGPSDAPSAGKSRSPSQGTQVATAIGGGALTEGFDAAIDSVTGIETQTRIDSTNANNPRPELEVAVSRDVSIRFSYVLGTPPPSEPDKSLGTVILRVSPNWSFSTTVGDKGKGTLDTMWQYRY